LKVAVCPADHLYLISMSTDTWLTFWEGTEGHYVLAGKQILKGCNASDMITVDVKTSDELVFSLSDVPDVSTMASLFSLGFMIVICPWLLGFFVKSVRKVLFAATGHDE